MAAVALPIILKILYNTKDVESTLVIWYCKTSLSEKHVITKFLCKEREPFLNENTKNISVIANSCTASSIARFSSIFIVGRVV